MRPYLLLTPGPLTTSETVKEAMMSDWCTWDEDYNVGIVEVIRKELVELASSQPEDYTAVLMQGSGSFCADSFRHSTHQKLDSEHHQRNIGQEDFLQISILCFPHKYPR